MVKRATHGRPARTRVGVAISPTELVAAHPSFRTLPGGVWRVPLDPAPGGAGAWPSLAAAFASLARQPGVAGGRLAISLMPPLAELRRVELPPVRAEDLHRLLSRGASRYFVNARGPQVVGVSPAARRVRGAPLPVIAAAAPAALLAAIRHAALETGWAIDAVAPAENAWVAAGLASSPAGDRNEMMLIVAQDDRTDLLGVAGGVLTTPRRFRPGDADAPAIAEAIGQAGHAAVLGSPIPRTALATALGSLGVSLAAMRDDSAPAVLAARFAGSETGPLLRAEETLMAERRRARGIAWRIAAAAVVLLGVAAAIELWGVRRQLALVRAEREQLRPEIAATMVGRTTIDAAYRHLTALDAVDRSAPHWSSVIAGLTAALPDEAFLTAVRTRGDSVVVDGLAEHAARVFDALERSGGLTGVRAAAPVRRELRDGGVQALEHFLIAARVAPAAARPPRDTAAGGRRAAP